MDATNKEKRKREEDIKKKKGKAIFPYILENRWLKVNEKCIDSAASKQDHLSIYRTDIDKNNPCDTHVKSFIPQILYSSSQTHKEASKYLLRYVEEEEWPIRIY